MRATIEVIDGKIVFTDFFDPKPDRDTPFDRKPSKDMRPMTVEGLLHAAESLARQWRLPYADPVKELRRISQQDQIDASSRDFGERLDKHLRDEGLID